MHWNKMGVCFVQPIGHSQRYSCSATHYGSAVQDLGRIQAAR